MKITAKEVTEILEQEIKVSEDSQYFINSLNCYEHGVEVVFGGGNLKSFVVDITKFLNFYYRGLDYVDYRNNIVTLHLGCTSSLEDAKEVANLVKKFVESNGGRVVKTNF